MHISKLIVPATRTLTVGRNRHEVGTCYQERGEENCMRYRSLGRREGVGIVNIMSKTEEQVWALPKARSIVKSQFLGPVKPSSSSQQHSL